MEMLKKPAWKNLTPLSLITIFSILIVIIYIAGLYIFLGIPEPTAEFYTVKVGGRMRSDYIITRLVSGRVRNQAPGDNTYGITIGPNTRIFDRRTFPKQPAKLTDIKEGQIITVYCDGNVAHAILKSLPGMTLIGSSSIVQITIDADS